MDLEFGEILSNTDKIDKTWPMYIKMNHPVAYINVNDVLALGSCIMPAFILCVHRKHSL